MITIYSNQKITNVSEDLFSGHSEYYTVAFLTSQIIKISSVLISER